MEQQSANADRLRSILEALKQKRRNDGASREPSAYSLDIELMRQLNNVLDTYDFNRSSYLEYQLADLAAVDDIAKTLIGKRELLHAFESMFKAYVATHNALTELFEVVFQVRESSRQLTYLAHIAGNSPPTPEADLSKEVAAAATYREACQKNFETVTAALVMLLRKLASINAQWCEQLAAFKEGVIGSFVPIDDWIERASQAEATCIRRIDYVENHVLHPQDFQWFYGHFEMGDAM